MADLRQMLSSVEADLVEGDVRIRRRREIIADLEARGQNAELATEILDDLLRTHHENTELLGVLRAKLSRESWPDGL